MLNKIGTYQIALVAKALQVPFYVAVESYKFSRMYPLSQRDVTDLSVLPDLLSAPPSVSHSTSNASGAHGGQAQSHSQSQVHGHVHGHGGPANLSKPNFCAIPASPSKIKRSFTDLASALPANVVVEQQSIDFTPAKCITLLFTDIGVLTPAAVSDELIRLYQ